MAYIQLFDAFWSADTRTRQHSCTRVLRIFLPYSYHSPEDCKFPLSWTTEFGSHVNRYLPSLLHHQDIPDKASSPASSTSVLCSRWTALHRTAPEKPCFSGDSALLPQLTCCFHPLQNLHACGNTYAVFVSLTKPLVMQGQEQTPSVLF